MHLQKYACVQHGIKVTWEPGVREAAREPPEGQPKNHQSWSLAGDEVG